MATHPLEEILRSRQHDFLQPTPDLHAAVIQLAKEFLDPLASNLTAIQSRRLQFQRQNKKRKRGAVGVDASDDDLLRMRKVHVEGFDVDQVWQQAKRVLNAATVEVERQVPAEESEMSEESLGEGEGAAPETEYDEEGSIVDGSEGGEDEGTEENREGDELDEGEDMEGLELMDGEDDLSEEDGLADGQETPPSDVSEDEQAAEVLVKDKHGLNDGFFSIDDFNKRTQFLEDIDARGAGDDGAASDEEDVDWYADPTTMDIQPTAAQRSKAGKKVTEEEEGSDEDGPTFGNVDLNAPDGDSEDEDMGDAPENDTGMGDMNNTNDIQYKDFYEPPARQASKKKNAGKPRGPRPVESLATENDYEGDMERTMQAVHRDLFDEDLSDEEAGDDVPADRKNLSSHEAAQLALRAEIQRLEAANVAPKNWSLTGETVAPRRPLNSLLEEDLDFERAGKPVPVITADINEAIEELIRRRIVAKEFDEVVRRRPDDLLTGNDARRGRLRDELSDAKPAKGLAEEYEQDHLRRTDANYVDTRTEALKKTHREIEAQWLSISAQLDSLSNWHYKPKPAAPSLDIRVDVATISMEDARPSAGGEVGGASTLAPQEVYKPGDEGRRTDEVLTKGGTVLAKDEETRDQRKRRRNRDKKRSKKAGGAAAATTSTATGTTAGAPAKKGSRAERAEVLGQLKKGGVKVIGKGGALTKVDGSATRTDGERKSAGVYKL